MMVLIDRLNQERHKLSSLGSLLLVFFVFSMAQAIKGPAEMLAQEAMELTTTLIEPLLQPPPKTPPPQVKQPEPKPKMLALPNMPMTPAPIEPVSKCRCRITAAHPHTYTYTYTHTHTSPELADCNPCSRSTQGGSAAASFSQLRKQLHR